MCSILIAISPGMLRIHVVPVLEMLLLAGWYWTEDRVWVF